MQLTLLPGMDGTGDLFAPLEQALTVPSNVIRYDTAQSSYDALLESLPAPTKPTLVVAESFGGPLAIRWAAREPHVKALVLIATFTRGPRLTRWLAPLTTFAPTRPPAFVARALMLGGEDPSALLAAINKVPVATLKARIAEVARVDVRRELASLRIPIVWVVGTRDRLVPSPTEGRIVRIDGPHLLAQTRPNKVAAVIRSL